MKIAKIFARQILDSRGIPTIEVDAVLENGIIGRAAVPSGASTGIHEAVELRDSDSKMGVGKAVENVNQEIAAKIIGMEIEDQGKIDQILIEIDGTENKSRLGENIGTLSLNRSFSIPQPMILLMEGGKHGNWATDIQEYMVMPGRNSNLKFEETLYSAHKIFQALEKILIEKEYSTGVGFEGGFCPRELKSNEEALELIIKAIEKAGYKAGEDFVLAIDFAASEFYRDGIYLLKSENEKKYTAQEWKEKVIEWTKNYPIYSIEDVFAEDEWSDWTSITSGIGKDYQIIGDDLTTTNPSRIKKAIDTKAINGVIIKLNQIGTVSETIEAVNLLKQAGLQTIVSHRAGETNDYFIADFAVGAGAAQCKFGGPNRGERLAKYNELLRIEELLKN